MKKAGKAMLAARAFTRSPLVRTTSSPVFIFVVKM